MRALTIAAALALGLATARAARADEKDEAAKDCVEGMLLLEDGKPKEALAYFNKAIARDPKFASAYAYRGRAYADLKQLARAVQDCTAALRLDPQLAKAYHHRGCAYHLARQYRLALRDYDTALRLDPKDAAALSDRGAARLEVRDLGGALRDFDAAIALDPKNAEAYGNRAAARQVQAILVQTFGRGAGRAFGKDPTADKVARLEADVQADLDRCFELNAGLRPHFQRLINSLRSRARLGQMFQQKLDDLFGGLAGD